MNKLNSSNSFSYPKRKQNLLKTLYDRVSERELQKHPEIKDAIKPKPVFFFEYLRQDKPPVKEETLNAQSRNKKHFKFINQINNVRNVFNESLKFQMKQKSKMQKVFKLTQNFTKDYEEYKEKEKKAQYSPSNPFDNLTTKYEEMKYKLPNVKSQGKHNVFRQNPLIEKKQKLDGYYKYYREPHVHTRAMNYIKKVDRIVSYRIMSNAESNEDRLTQVSMDRHYEYERKNNKRAQLALEIQQNQSDIQTVSKSIEDADSIDNFYTTKVKFTKKKMPIQLKHKAKMNMTEFKKAKENDKSLSRELNSTSSKRINKSFETKYNEKALGTDKRSVSNIFTENRLPLESIYEECLNDTALKANLSEVILDYFSSNSKHIVPRFSNNGILKELNKTENKIVRSYIEDAYDLQRGKHNKIDYPIYQQKILNKNNSLKKTLFQTKHFFLKMIHNPQLVLH